MRFYKQAVQDCKELRAFALGGYTSCSIGGKFAGIKRKELIRQQVVHCLP